MTLWHKPEDLCRLTDNFRTSGNSLAEFYLNLETYAGERTIFGPNKKLSKSMETSAGWRTYRFGILPILLNLETFAGWRTIVGKNVKYKLLLAVKHTGAHGLKYMTLGNTKKHGSVLFWFWRGVHWVPDFFMGGGGQDGISQRREWVIFQCPRSAKLVYPPPFGCLWYLS